jgi:hypothetical protein
MKPSADPKIDQSDQVVGQFRLIDVKPLHVGRVFALAISAIVVVGAAADYALFNLVPSLDHPLADILKRFDLGHEPSLPALYSSAVMLANACLLFFLGRYDLSGGTFRRANWYALSFLFVLLGIDEVVMFHEMGTAALDRLDLSGPFYFSWIIPGFIFAAAIGLGFARFLLSLNRPTGFLLFLAGFIFISGAIGMEFIAGLIFAAAGSEEEALKSIEHVLVQAVEEALEMAGVALFLCTLLDYVNRCGLQIAVRNSPPASNEAS